MHHLIFGYASWIALAIVVIACRLMKIVPFSATATFDWEEDNGAATGSPAKGTTRTTGRTEVNWKNIDDSTTAYTSNPISAGSNSFEKWIFGKFSGTYNTILNGFFAHT